MASDTVIRARIDGRVKERAAKVLADMGLSVSDAIRLLHRIKLSWLAPRPRHPEADATAQAEFSQHLDCN